jgi:hypothetical protein
MQKWLWGYNEIRNLYKRSGFSTIQQPEEQKHTHWLDLWIKAGTAVLAAVDGLFIVLL